MAGEGVLDIQERAQDVSEAAGTAYQDIGNTVIPTYKDYDAEKAGLDLDEHVQIQSGLDAVDQDKSTVQGQLTSLLDTDSPYIQQARMQGERQAAGRGMLNTSMASGAAQAEATKAALPIATQDAQTYAQAQGMEQAANIKKNELQAEGILSGELTKQQAAVKAADQRLQNMFQAQLQGATEANTALLTGMQQANQSFMQDLEAEHQKLLQREDISAKQADAIAQTSSAIMQNYQISVENMMTDPDFLGLGPDAVNNAVNELQSLARNSINFVGASQGVDLTGYVDQYLADISVM